MAEEEKEKEKEKETDIHASIRDKLTYFYNSRKIPNIMFSGKNGVGKSTLLNFLVGLIYQHDKHKIREFVMYVNCAHGKGIKFVRDELKFFAKTNIHSHSIKCIVLFNGDKLTTDAQSALRRCIELFSNNTRFFIEVEDKYKLLKPILSRFCEINVPSLKNSNSNSNSNSYNVYQQRVNHVFHLQPEEIRRRTWLKRELLKHMQKQQQEPTSNNVFALKLYDHAYSAMDIVELIERDNGELLHVPEHKKYEWLLTFHKACKEIRCETLLIGFVLHFICVDPQESLDTLDTFKG